MARRGLTNLLVSTIKTRTQELQILEPYSKKSPLHCAIEAKKPAILEIFHKSPNILPLVNQRNHFSRTPLHTAALLGDNPACRLLLSTGADPDTRDRWDDPPIVLAHANGHLEVMLVLIKADINKIAKHKIDLKRLFFFAVEKGDADVAERLIGEYGVDRSVQNSEGSRAEHIAKAANDEAMLRVLDAAPMLNFEVKGREILFVPFRSRPVEL